MGFRLPLPIAKPPSELSHSSRIQHIPLRQPSQAGLVHAVAQQAKAGGGVGVGGEGDAHVFAELDGGVAQVEVVGLAGRSRMDEA